MFSKLSRSWTVFILDAFRKFETIDLFLSLRRSLSAFWLLKTTPTMEFFNVCDRWVVWVGVGWRGRRWKPFSAYYIFGPFCFMKFSTWSLLNKKVVKQDLKEGSSISCSKGGWICFFFVWVKLITILICLFFLRFDRVIIRKGLKCRKEILLGSEL